MRATLVVKLDDAKQGGGPGTVIEVTSDNITEVMRRYEDRDGGRSDRIRFWKGYRGAKVGDRVSL